MADPADRRTPIGGAVRCRRHPGRLGGAARVALADIVLAHLAGPAVDVAALVEAAHVAWQKVSDTAYDRLTADEVNFATMRVNRMAAFLAAIARPGAANSA